MAWRQSPAIDDPNDDPLGQAMADALSGLLVGTSVELAYSQDGTAAPVPRAAAGTASATGPGPAGWQVTVIVRLDDRVARLVASGRRTTLAELLEALPGAGLRAAGQLRHRHRDEAATPLGPALQRALRDIVAGEILSGYLESRVGRQARLGLIAETIDFLIELSGSRVEGRDLTHGVVVANVLPDPPRLQFAYPAEIRSAKRAPLLFDGQRSVLVVDLDGLARTELQRHRFERLTSKVERGNMTTDDWLRSGSLVAEATSVLGGLGFFVRADRTIWSFVDGQPLLVRLGEHWTSFPLELSASIADMIGGGVVAALVAGAAFIISAQPAGAILAIVDDPVQLDGVVPPKDRYDRREDIDPAAMRTETRLHHLIDAGDLDVQTLVRLAMLDGATVLDRNGRLLAYGAIVTSNDSQHEGARTAAARTLSETSLVVLKVSVDGDITIFRQGTAVTTLLGRTPEAPLQ